MDLFFTIESNTLSNTKQLEYLLINGKMPLIMKFLDKDPSYVIQALSALKLSNVQLNNITLNGLKKFAVNTIYNDRHKNQSYDIIQKVLASELVKFDNIFVYSMSEKYSNMYQAILIQFFREKDLSFIEKFIDNILPPHKINQIVSEKAPSVFFDQKILKSVTSLELLVLHNNVKALEILITKGLRQQTIQSIVPVSHESLDLKQLAIRLNYTEIAELMTYSDRSIS